MKTASRPRYFFVRNVIDRGIGKSLIRPGVQANYSPIYQRHAAAEMCITMLLYEAGEALRFDEVAIRAGIRGVMSVMQALGMLTSKKISTSEIEPLVTDTTSWVRSPASGILRMKVPLRARVVKNSKINEITDPFGRQSFDINSPVSGMVIGRLNLHLVYRGDAVVHIAHLDRLKGIEPMIEGFREEIFEESW